MRLRALTNQTTTSSFSTDRPSRGVKALDRYAPAAYRPQTPVLYPVDTNALSTLATRLRDQHALSCVLLTPPPPSHAASQSISLDPAGFQLEFRSDGSVEEWGWALNLEWGLQAATAHAGGDAATEKSERERAAASELASVAHWVALGLITPKASRRAAAGMACVYDMPYSHPTSLAELVAAVGAGPKGATHMLVAAGLPDKPSFELAAAAPLGQLLGGKPAAVALPAAYWYCVPGKAFGFAAPGFGAPVLLSPGDFATDNASKRLSWHLDGVTGGFRCGSLLPLNNFGALRKYVYVYGLKPPTTASDAAEGFDQPVRRLGRVVMRLSGCVLA